VADTGTTDAPLKMRKLPRRLYRECEEQYRGAIRVLEIRLLGA
jgi:hypothetical protein